jgi:hypothetical protein
MILGTLLLVVVIGAAVAGAWRYRATTLGDRTDSRTAMSDEMLVALARQRDAELAQSSDSR